MYMSFYPQILVSGKNKQEMTMYSGPVNSHG